MKLKSKSLPMSHAKRVTRDNRKNPEYRVVAAMRKLRTDTNCPAGNSWPNHVKSEQHFRLRSFASLCQRVPFCLLNLKSILPTIWQKDSTEGQKKYDLSRYQITNGNLRRIQDLTKEGLDKRGSGGMLPRKIFNFRASEMRFPAFSGAIWSGLIALKSPPFLC